MRQRRRQIARNQCRHSPPSYLVVERTNNKYCVWLHCCVRTPRQKKPTINTRDRQRRPSSVITEPSRCISGAAAVRVIKTPIIADQDQDQNQRKWHDYQFRIDVGSSIHERSEVPGRFGSNATTFFNIFCTVINHFLFVCLFVVVVVPLETKRRK
jgi:hypothetical protein